MGYGARGRADSFLPPPGLRLCGDAYLLRPAQHPNGADRLPGMTTTPSRRRALRDAAAASGIQGSSVGSGKMWRTPPAACPGADQ